MSTIIVYVDDAAHAASRLPLAAPSTQLPAVHWVLVACAPRITHRVSRFVSNRSRENWRNKWAERLFAECTPLFTAQGHTVTTVLARGPLPELLEALQAEHGAQCAVLDWRRPKIESADVVVPPQPSSLSKLAGTFTGIGALWAVLVGETLAA